MKIKIIIFVLFSLIFSSNINLNDSTYNMNNNDSLIYQEVDLYDQLLSESKYEYT